MTADAPARTTIRAAVALALTGRFAVFGRQAAEGLGVWARARGVRLRIEDDRGEPAVSARLCASLAAAADLVFGPYGSGCGRAVGEVMADRREVVWNHGAAAVPGPRGRMIDVLGPAGSYWRGLPAVVGDDPVAVVRAPGGFGGEIAAGACAALAAAGREPVLAAALGPGVARAAREAGAVWVAGGGRMEDDLALARSVAGEGLRGALVVCGVAEAAAALGDAVLGWVGPVQWDGTPGPLPPPAGADYPAAQAVAAALVAEEALALAGTTEPDALWDAARALRTSTLIGPFAVDAEGRQTAHAPAIVRWEEGPSGPVRRVTWRPGGGGA